MSPAAWTGLAAVLQLVGLLLLVGELLAYRALSAWYVSALTPFGADASGLPSVSAPDRLARLNGARGALRYRWDPTRRALLFGRALRVLPGERGQFVGLVRFHTDGRPVVSWRPAGLSVLGVFLALATYGLLYFAVVEGEPAALLGVPMVLAMLAAMSLIAWFNARTTLHRALLPLLADLLEEADLT